MRPDQLEFNLLAGALAGAWNLALGGWFLLAAGSMTLLLSLLDLEEAGRHRPGEHDGCEL